MKINPDDEGITHINMYSKSRTELGWMLSNFYHYDFSTPEGTFSSIEAYWYWLSLPDTCNEKENLRPLYGFSAKQFGMYLLIYNHKIQRDNFETKILYAIWDKFQTHRHLITPQNMNLPIIHYFIKGNEIQDKTQDHPWMIIGINQMMNKLAEPLKTVRIIVAGSREFNDFNLLSLAVDQVIKEIQPVNVEIISGTCKGTDRLGERYGDMNGYAVRRFYPDWDKYGLAAGPIRNKQMAKYAAEYSNGYLIAFWDGSSKGTKNMIETARLYGLKIEVINI